MVVTPDSVARFAGLLADRSRVAMCLALIDGRAWTAGELATHAGISRSTASEHLSALVTAGILAQEHQGRHRYLRLAGPEIAQLIEDLVAVVGVPQQPNSLRSVRAAGQLQAARTCYDHVAGDLGVAVFDALVRRRLIDVADGLRLTPSGRDFFVDFAGPDAVAPHRSRPLLRTCLDWTERRHHLGGALGAVVLQQLLARGWVVRAARHRALAVTGDGAIGLKAAFGVDVPATPDADRLGA
nr:winged helix-turn-helix domain-containing protein [Nakamurella panacisegetis]